MDQEDVLLLHGMKERLSQHFPLPVERQLSLALEHRRHSSMLNPRATSEKGRPCTHSPYFMLRYV